MRDAWNELRACLRYHSLLRYLVSSSLQKENRNTVLGFVWWVLDPLLLAAVFVVLVGVFLQRGGPDFPVFVLSGIIVWEGFAKSTRDAMVTTLSKERSMRQVAYPKAVIPVASVLSGYVHFAFGYCVLLVVAIAFGILPSAYALLGIPIALVQLVFTLGFAFFLAALNVFFRDTNRLIRYVFRLWFYLSPIIYPVSRVPENIRGIYELNPFATLITAYRDVVMEHTLPDFTALAIVGGASLLMLIAGYLFFVRLQPWFVKLV